MRSHPLVGPSLTLAVASGHFSVGAAAVAAGHHGEKGPIAEPRHSHETTATRVGEPQVGKPANAPAVGQTV